MLYRTSPYRSALIAAALAVAAGTAAPALAHEHGREGRDHDAGGRGHAWREEHWRPRGWHERERWYADDHRAWRYAAVGPWPPPPRLLIAPPALMFRAPGVELVVPAY